MLNAVFRNFRLSTANEKLEMVQESKQTEMDENKKVVDGGKESKNENKEPALTSSSEVMMKEVQEESVKPDEDTMKSEVGMAEPASGKDGELCRNKVEKEGQKQEEGEE